MATVAVTQNNDIAVAVEQALDHLDVQNVVRDRYVAVKPNETSATEDDKTGVTQPDTLQALLQYLKPLGPCRLVVSGGSGAGETEEIMRIAGMMDVLEQETVEFCDHNRPPFVEVELEYAPELENGPAMNRLDCRLSIGDRQPPKSQLSLLFSGAVQHP